MTRPASTSGPAPRSAPEDRPSPLDALASLSDGILVVDTRLDIVYANAAAARLAGVKGLPEDRRRWSEELGVFRPDEKTPFPWEELPLVRALAGEATHDVEMFVKNAGVPAGVHLAVSGSPLRDAAGQIRGGAILYRDISERRAQELRLREGERQKKAILDNIPDMAWLKDRAGRFLAVNLPFAQAAGHARAEDVVGLTDLDLWPTELAEGYRADDEDVMRTAQHKRVEERLIDAQGRSRWIETIKTCIVGDDGEVLGTTGLARDITERRLADEALRLSKDELERRVVERTAELAEAQENLVRKERLAVLGQLAGGVAHQIRNPLAAIMNATYVLRRHLPRDQHPNVEDALRIIHDAVRHANVIITGLLDYARVRTPDRQPTSLVELVERVLGSDWMPSNLRVERAFEPVPLLDIDADQLHGAVFNLVRNAVEAMGDGGTLRIEIRVDREHVLLVVADSGPGISPNVRPHLFEPLRSTKPLGVGLGLVTARTFVEAHGGRIRLADSPSGARFEIRLPVG